MSDNELQLFSQRLKELRTSLGLTQANFVEGTGITPSALSSYEKNIKNPSISVAKRISDKYNVSLDWLCGINSSQHKTIELKTYSDLMNILFQMDEEEFLNFNLLLEDDKCGIIFDNDLIYDLINDWNKMRSLLDTHVIDWSLYSLWKEKTLSACDIKLKRSYLSPNEDTSTLNAAHEIEGATQEDKDHDDAIMDNEDEWK